MGDKGGGHRGQVIITWYKGVDGFALCMGIKTGVLSSELEVRTDSGITVFIGRSSIV